MQFEMYNHILFLFFGELIQKYLHIFIIGLTIAAFFNAYLPWLIQQECKVQNKILSGSRTAKTKKSHAANSKIQKPPKTVDFV